ncbi:UNVERIFIED_CONTAM: hypothetical protein GTU68_006959 [Idotea baltica]|nr:hypothetical protein [Idotea baltica]
MSELDLEQTTIDCLKIVREVGSYIREQQEKVSQKDIITKDPNSFVTYVDKQSEIKLHRALSALVPEATFITEEATMENADSDLVWIIDPLDGTTNFLYGIPMYSISVALKVRQKVAVGVVYAIQQDEIFYAWQGGGAYVNNRRISVAGQTALQQALIGTGFPYNKATRMELPSRIFAKVLAKSRGVRRLGSAAMDLAYVAIGRLDGYYESHLNSYDIAAGGLIVQEAGGVVSDYGNTEQWINGESIIAANPGLHRLLQSVIASV